MNKSKSVTLENIVKIFKDPQSGQDVKAVDNVSFRLEPGELVTLLGPSGCGKTTVLRMLSGFEQPTSGRIMIGDNDVTFTQQARYGDGLPVLRLVPAHERL